MRQIIQIICSLFFVLGYLAPASSQIVAQKPYEVEYDERTSIKDFRLAVGGGYAYRIGKINKTNDAAIDNLSKKLRNGYNLNIDGQYFFKEKWGLGMDVNMASFSTSGGGFTSGGSSIITYEEKQRMVYLGPTFATRLETDKFLLTAALGFGPLFFINDITANGINGTGNQTTFGSSLMISGEYKMQNKMGLGLKLSQVAGNIDKLNFEGQTIASDEVINLSSFCISLFLSFRTW